MIISENKKQIINLLFPIPTLSITEIEKKYPPRNLGAEAMVTRIAPSPTGFFHIGNLYAALICERLAHQSGGVFFLRVEDTDKKREVAGASKLVTASLANYGIKADEGETVDGTEQGNYGPYKQSERAEIYLAYVKQLFEKGLAYPCFCTSEELEETRSKQEAAGIRPGYYGEWAIWRDRSDKDVLEALRAGKKFVIRFRSSGNFENKITAHDVLLGSRELSENDQDIVIMKQAGLPTYHMAHVIDDHLMGTTHVLRGNEWFSSLALHIQLFQAMDWPLPKFGHIFPIQKMEGTSKRKLSKRKDPEANIAYYEEQGYPKNGVIEYLLNLANSNFEDWRKANQDKDYQEFELTLKKLASSNGPLFDLAKLSNISKEIIAKYSAEIVYDQALVWAKKHDQELLEMLEKNKDYCIKILDIERNNSTKSRKDIGKWSDVKSELVYFFDDKFLLGKEDAMELLCGIDRDDIKKIRASYLAAFNENDSREEWFEKIKAIAQECGFAASAKEFKENPEKYKGNVADVAKVLRVLLTGKTQTPDLYSIVHVMGAARVGRRLGIF